MQCWAALGAAAALLLSGCAAARGDQPAAFRDPAPPERIEPGPAKVPSWERNPRATFHQEPQPLPAGAQTSDWPDFLGPSRDMSSPETGLLEEFPPEGPALVWELQSGTGYAAPTVVDGRLFYFHRVGDEERLECLHPETGELAWSFSYPTAFSDRYGYNNGPRAAPIVAGDRVFLYGAEGKLHCLRASDGELLWKRDVAKEFGVPQDFFGTASSPLIEGNLLILNIGAPGGPTVAAFDIDTGRLAWGAGEEWGPSYASPVAADIGDRRRVFVFAGGESRPPAGGLLAIDPATGKIDFAFPWRSRSYESVNASTPLAWDRNVLISATYRTGAALLRLGLDGGYELAWTNPDFDLHWAAPQRIGGHLYAFTGRNEPDAALSCLDAETGRMVWEEVLEWEETIEWHGQTRTLAESPFRGWLLAVDGRMLSLGEHGHLLWLALSPEGPEIEDRATLFLARETWTPPVLSHGLLYVRQNYQSLGGDPPRLLCYDLRGRGSTRK